MEPLPIVGITLGTLIIIFNILEIHCLHRKGAKKSNFEYILLSLSCSDLMIGFIYVSGWIWLLLARKYSHLLEYNAVMVTLGSLIHLSIESSVLHLTIIAIERLVAILIPMKLKCFLTKKKTKVMLGIVWVTCFATQAIFTGLSFARIGTDKLPVFQGCLILIVGTVLGATHIGLIIYMKTVVDRNLRRFKSNSDSCRFGGIDKRKERRVELTCLAVVLGFVICNFPIAVTWIKTWKEQRKPHPVVESIFVANSIVNSLLYFWSNSSRRQNKGKKRETVSLFSRDKSVVLKMKTTVEDTLI